MGLSKDKVDLDKYVAIASRKDTQELVKKKRRAL
jgi:hypothetical protein